MRLRTQSVPSKTSTVFMGRLLSSGTAESVTHFRFSIAVISRETSVSVTHLRKRNKRCRREVSTGRDLDRHPRWTPAPGAIGQTAWLFRADSAGPGRRFRLHPGRPTEKALAGGFYGGSL